MKSFASLLLGIALMLAPSSLSAQTDTLLLTIKGGLEGTFTVAGKPVPLPPKKVEWGDMPIQSTTLQVPRGTVVQYQLVNKDPGYGNLQTIVLYSTRGKREVLPLTGSVKVDGRVHIIGSSERKPERVPELDVLISLYKQFLSVDNPVPVYQTIIRESKKILAQYGRERGQKLIEAARFYAYEGMDEFQVMERERLQSEKMGGQTFWY